MAFPCWRQCTKLLRIFKEAQDRVSISLYRLTSIYTLINLQFNFAQKHYLNYEHQLVKAVHKNHLSQINHKTTLLGGASSEIPESLNVKRSIVLHRSPTPTPNSKKKKNEPLQNSRRQKGDTKEVPYLGSTYIRRHHGNLAPGICAPMTYRRIQVAQKSHATTGHV